MTGPTRPDEIRATTFDQSLRGYDREAVERFRDAVAGEIESLIARIGELESGGSALGIEEAESLRIELATVGDDVAEVLAAAQRAAEGIRSRAAADAATWRADADAEARAARNQAQRDAEKARGDAWETASELLEHAQTTATNMLETAADDALFIRAEAEREALRLTGDARRDQDEIMRKSRVEADRMIDAARVESGKILETARQSAESAQERARALERRRAELMEELEAARLSIGQLEQEIDTRREALATAADSPDSGVRIVGVGDDYGWRDDDTSVRVVPAHVASADEPVDADSLVAEVEALQAAIEAVSAPPIALEPEAEVVAGEPEPDESGVVESGVVDSGVVEPEAEVDAVEPEPDDSGVVDSGVVESGVDEPEPVDDAPPVEVAPPVDVAPTEEPPARTSELDSIFARLREPQAAPTNEADTPTASAETDDASPQPPSASEDQPAERADEPVPGTPARPAGRVDPFDLRDRVLLPIENRALRSIKRRIVDLQNRVLEELRVGGDDWVPDRALLAAAVGDEMASVAAESHVAGHSAAADLSGRSTTPRPERGPSTDDSASFVAALDDAVTEALSRARAAGGGSRQVAAGVGRVFRAWRTDEAERRVRAAARRSYNEGVLAGLQLLGVERVVAVAAGTPCGECPATSGAAWRPGDQLPRGTVFPPAGPGCTATIVPAQ